MIYLIHPRPTRKWSECKFLLPDPPDPRIIRSARGFNRHPRITSARVRAYVCVLYAAAFLQVFFFSLNKNPVAVYVVYR